MELIKEERKPQATVSGSYKYAWQQMWKYFLYLFIISVVVGLLQSPASALQDSEWEHTPGMILLQILFAAYGLLFLPVVKYGADLLYLKGMRNEKIDISQLFDGFKNNYLNNI